MVREDNHAIKDDTMKPRMELLPPDALVEIAKVFTMGAEKYSDRNWERGMDWGRIYAATMRHLSAFWSGEDIDSEWGYSHLAHAGCSILMLLATYMRNIGNDSRQKLSTVNMANMVNILNTGVDSNTGTTDTSNDNDKPIDPTDPLKKFFDEVKPQLDKEEEQKHSSDTDKNVSSSHNTVNSMEQVSKSTDDGTYHKKFGKEAPNIDMVGGNNNNKSKVGLPKKKQTISTNSNKSEVNCVSSYLYRRDNIDIIAKEHTTNNGTRYNYTIQYHNSTNNKGSCIMVIDSDRSIPQALLMNLFVKNAKNGCKYIEYVYRKGEFEIVRIDK